MKRITRNKLCFVHWILKWRCVSTTEDARMTKFTVTLHVYKLACLNTTSPFILLLTLFESQTLAVQMQERKESPWYWSAIGQILISNNSITHINSESLYSVIQEKNVADHLRMLPVPCQLRCSYIVGSASRQSETCGHYCPHWVCRQNKQKT